MSPPIVVSRHISAPPSAVYSYLTESTRWAKWQGANASIEPRPGGEFVMTMPDGAIARGEFVELVPDRRVVFTWGWVDHPSVPPGSSTVEVQIVEEVGGSLVTLTHRDLPDDETSVHASGWNHYLPRLAAVAEGRAVPRDAVPPDQVD